MSEQDAKQLMQNKKSGLPRVAVVMATYNGKRYLREQIDSIFSQSGVCVSLFVYDDCSTDGTWDYLEELSVEYGLLDMDIHIQRGERNLGFPTSFFCALDYVHGEFDFYAYSDQDDIWKGDKLSVAVTALNEAIASGGNCLYFEPTTAVDEQLNFLFERNIDYLVLSLQSFFVRARVAAHTMVFNEGLKSEICRLGVEHNGFSHGWIALLIAIATKANIVVGKTSHTLHRRLDSSVSAGGKGFLDRVSFEWRAIVSPEVCRTPMAKILLDNYGCSLTDDEISFLKDVAEYKENVSSKLRLLRPESYHTDIPAVNAEAALSILFNRY